MIPLKWSFSLRKFIKKFQKFSGSIIVLATHPLIQWNFVKVYQKINKFLKKSCIILQKFTAACLGIAGIPIIFFCFFEMFCFLVFFFEILYFFLIVEYFWLSNFKVYSFGTTFIKLFLKRKSEIFTGKSLITT